MIYNNITLNRKNSADGYLSLRTIFMSRNDVPMNSISTLCSKIEDKRPVFVCPHERIIKNERTTNNKQRYRCSHCGKQFIEKYTYRAYHSGINAKIIRLLKEGVGIRSTARLLKISATTVLERILQIAKKVSLPIISKGKTYEVDELRTFIKRKDRLIWIVYALDRVNKQVVSFNIGPRTNKTLNVVLKTLELSVARKIYTDKLINYQYLIQKPIHCTDYCCTNHIERKNLTLRTHLKRLNRRTICFSKSTAMLQACLMIYFLG